MLFIIIITFSLNEITTVVPIPANHPRQPAENPSNPASLPMLQGHHRKMQVFISDTHLTDGTSGRTIRPGAFALFCDNLKNLVKTVNRKSTVSELKIVLLGDIFDVIRSTRWLDGAVRPWSDPGPEQQAMVTAILDGIIRENKKSLSHLNALRDFAQKQSINFEMHYVIGNHDWLINRYPETRRLAAEALGMPDAAAAPTFPEEIFDPAYRTIARHGDRYDDLNCMGSRDSSSIGDAIVIDLLNRFPEEAGRALDGLVDKGAVTPGGRAEIVENLKEIDNVRPLLDVPCWVLMTLNRIQNDAARKAVEAVWCACVDEFFKIPFIKHMDVPFRPDAIDKLQIALHLSSRISKRLLESIADFKTRYFPSAMEGDYHRRALAEPKVRSGEADCVIYGHTHDHLILPMDQVPAGPGDIRNRIYFNTGTWRQTWNRVALDPANREFIGWKVLTYIAFYRKEENNQYHFEVWNGALG